MTAVLAIATTGLRRLLRDRQGLFFIVALPFIVILLFGAGGEQQASGLPVGLVVAEGDLADSLVAALEADGAVAVTRYDDVTAMTRAVRRDTLVGGLDAGGLGISGHGADGIDPTGPAAGPVELRWVTDPGAPAGATARVAVAAAVAELDARLGVAPLATQLTGADPDQAAAVTAALPDASTVTVSTQAVAGEAFTFGVDESAQANLVLFVFITSLTGATYLIQARQWGTTHRMLATPTSVPLILAGEATARFAIAGVQAVIILVGASLLFGASWGDPLAVSAVLVLLCLAGTGAAMLFGATLSSVDQAGAIAAPLGIGLGMIGGAIWPLEIVPAPMQTLGRVVPHSWAMDALREIGSRGGTIIDVTTELAVLAGFAAVLLAIATWRLSMTLRRP